MRDLVLEPLDAFGPAVQKLLQKCRLGIGYEMDIFQNVALSRAFPQVFNSRQHQLKQGAEIERGFSGLKSAQVLLYILILQPSRHILPPLE